MKNIVLVFCAALLIAACKGKQNEGATAEKKEKKEELVIIENDQYMEYYPGRKQIKFKGMQDAEGRREGQWIFYAEDGTESSVTHYMNGKKNGHSIVKYPNGAVHYIGEYKDDEKIGVWRIYDEKGEVTEKDFGSPE